MTMTLLGRQDSNLGYAVQSRVPYHLATPQCLSYPSTDTPRSSVRQTRADKTSNAPAKSLGIWPSSHQQCANEIQSSASPQDHENGANLGSRYRETQLTKTGAAGQAASSAPPEEDAS